MTRQVEDPAPLAPDYFRSAAEHPSSAAVLRYFQFAHLPEGPLRDTSKMVAELAETLAGDFPPSPEFTAGLRKLLEAKDCFVRAALDLMPPRG